MITKAQRDSIKAKFARANRDECQYALQDIRETFAALGPQHHDAAYFAKLNCERDAVLDRLAALEGKETCPCCKGKGFIKQATH